MKKSILLILVLGAFGTGCSHLHKVASTEDKAEALSSEVQVKIGSPEVKEGDVVEVFNRICTTDQKQVIKAHKSHSCKSEKVGEAVIAKVISQEMAAVKPLNNLAIGPKMFVEKKK